MKNKTLLLILCLAIPLTVGFVSGFATAAGIKDWYAYLNKPFFNPPNYLFGPVWTLLYLLMGISLFMILKAPQHPLRKKAIAIFSLQLLLNFCWSFLFFYFQSPGWALVEIVLMWISILTMILVFYRIRKPAALMQIPYLMWVTFATALNAAIYILN